MDIDEIFRVIGRLYLDNMITIDKLLKENRELKEKCAAGEKKAGKGS